MTRDVLRLAIISSFSLFLMIFSATAQTSVTLYYWGNETDILAVDLVQDFESMHDGRDGNPPIKVIIGQSASINKTDDPQRLLCGIAGGDPPDVVFYDRFAVGEWASRGAFESLQPFYEQDLEERPDDPFTIRADQFYQATWEEANYKGELFAIPSDTDNRAMYYNQDLFDKHAPELIAAGCVDPLDPTKAGPPQTWEQLRAATRILTEYDENGRMIRAGFIPVFGNSWLYIFGWLNGGEFMSADGRTCTLNDPRIVEALAYMTELYGILGGAEAAAAFQASVEGGDLHPFMAGKVAMMIDGDGFVTNIANLRRDMRFGVVLAPAPEGKQRLGWCGGWSWVIPRGAQYPEEAWEFIKYLSSQRAYRVRNDAAQQATVAQGNVFIPLLSSRRDITEWAMEHYLYSDPTIPDRFKEAKRVFVESMPYSRYRPVTPVGQILWNEQRRAMESGIYLRYDADPRKNAQAAVDSGTEVVQAELERLFNPVEYPVIRWMPIILTYLAVLVIGVFALTQFFSRREGARGYFRQEHYAGYFFASPWFIGFVLFGGGPILFSLIMSVCQYDVLSPPRFVGLGHYIEMFTRDRLFFKSLWNTVFMAAFGVPLGMIVSLSIALLLNREIRGIAVYRTFFYLPSIMPAVAASILWFWIFNPQEGILNTSLSLVGINGPAWLQQKEWAKPALILMGLWGAGGNMIIWLAGLKGIPSHLYEAAEIDGAGPWRKFWNITLPMLSPYIFFNLIMGLIASFQIFTPAYIMTQGGPQDATLFYGYALFNQAFRYLNMGYASAMAWVLFAIVLTLTLIQLKLAPRWVHYDSD